MPFINNSRLTSAVNDVKARGPVRKPKMPIGVHVLYLSKVELRPLDDGRKSFDVEFVDQAGNFRPLTMNYLFMPKSGEEPSESMRINLEQMVSLFLDGYDHEMLNPDTAKEFMAQFTQFKGKPCQVAVCGRTRVMSPKDKPTELWQFIQPEIWYTGNVEKETLAFQVNKAIKPMSGKDLELWNNWKGTKHIAKDHEEEADGQVAKPANAAPVQQATEEVKAEEEVEGEEDVTFE